MLYGPDEGVGRAAMAEEDGGAALSPTRGLEVLALAAAAPADDMGEEDPELTNEKKRDILLAHPRLIEKRQEAIMDALLK